MTADEEHEIYEKAKKTHNVVCEAAREARIAAREAADSARSAAYVTAQVAYETTEREALLIARAAYKRYREQRSQS